MILRFFLLLVLGCLLSFSVYGQDQGPDALTGKLLDLKYQQMGTLWQVKVYLPEADSLRAQKISRQVKSLLDSLNQIFSDYDPESTLNQVVRKAHLAPVSIPKPLAEVISQAQIYARRSGGAFDISIGPLSRLWRRAFRRQVFPEREDIREAKKRVNYRWIQLENSQLRLKRKGMRLDLGGIAKGASVDYAADLLEQYGLNHYLIDGGGDIRVSGHPPGKKAWEIELPNGQIKEMNSGAIASSGAQYRYLSYQGRRYSHLIDPRTGYGVEGQKTVTVLAPTAMEADAWASVFSILDGKEASTLIAQLKERVLVYYLQN
ncbi:MAG TPA: FAD:protein FMN transferase [Saprospiraceae bacterium]|nr:FAD:protein FMN transferase [Saprospiraceae bacterium]